MSTSPPVILVVHGALGAAPQMMPVAEALRSLGDVRVVELPGHGDTPLGSTAFSIEGFAGALAAIAGTTRPVVFGHSMGGYVALALEARAPRTLRGIVTLGTKFDWTPDVAAREVARLNPRVIAEKVPKFAAALAARHERAGGWEVLLERTTALLTAAGASPVLTPGVLAKVVVPVRMAVGSLDDTVATDETTRAAAAVADGRAVVLEGVAHPIEKAPVDAIVVLVRELLAS